MPNARGLLMDEEYDMVVVGLLTFSMCFDTFQGHLSVTKDTAFNNT